MEDFSTPPEKRLDDTAKWLAEILTEENMTGTFFVNGEKARFLERSGRTDVISAVAKHEIGSHSNFGSIHPTITELLENMGWQAGVDSIKERETIGFDDIGRIFGKKVDTLSRHGGSYGPQLIAALGEMGKAHVYSLIHLENHNIVWFCNTLNFHKYVGGFTNVYYKDDLFEPVFEEFVNNFDQLAEENDFVIFYFGETDKIRSEQYSDFLNFRHGINTPPGEWKVPDLRPVESMEVAQNNFRRLLKFCRTKKQVEFTTFGDLMKRFSYQKKFITLDEIVSLANRIIVEDRPIIDKYFSAAEIFAALAGEIQEVAENGKFLEKVERPAVLGPLEMPLTEPKVQSVTREQINLIAKKAVSYIQQNGRLPSNIEVKGKEIGAGSLLQLFSRFLLDCREDSPKMSYPVVRFDPYPKDNEERLIRSIESCKNWVIHKPNLDMSKIVYYTKLQFWTLKPAVEGL
jgi:hypothetical protein